MSPLRKRFLEDMQLHGYSPKTQSCYVGAVHNLARITAISRPGHRGATAPRILHLTLERKSRAPPPPSLCGIKFFFQNTLQRT
jgi:hypothetical protein